MTISYVTPACDLARPLPGYTLLISNYGENYHAKQGLSSTSRVESTRKAREPMRWTSYPPISPFHETFPKHEVPLTLAYVDPKAQWRLCALRLSVVSESLSRAVALSLPHRPDRRPTLGRRPGAWLSRVIPEYRASVGEMPRRLSSRTLSSDVPAIGWVPWCFGVLRVLVTGVCLDIGGALTDGTASRACVADAGD